MGVGMGGNERGESEQDGGELYMYVCACGSVVAFTLRRGVPAAPARSLGPRT